MSGRCVPAEVKNVPTMKPEGYSCRFLQADVVGPENLEGLVLAVRERLGPFVAGAVRDHHAAEDVLQDVLVILIQQVHLLRQPDCFWPWVYRVAWSKVQDHFRDRRRARRTAAAAGREFLYPESTTGGLLDTMVRRESVEHLTAAFSQLNPRCRVVLYLRFYEQMPYAEIASLMHSTPSRVRIQFHRAKQLLRDSLLSSCA
jgi:RNA polymerase sigma factor (sigma-70 family)